MLGQCKSCGNDWIINGNNLTCYNCSISIPYNNPTTANNNIINNITTSNNKTCYNQQSLNSSTSHYHHHSQIGSYGNANNNNHSHTITHSDNYQSLQQQHNNSVTSNTSTSAVSINNTLYQNKNISTNNNSNNNSQLIYNKLKNANCGLPNGLMIRDEIEYYVLNEFFSDNKHCHRRYFRRGVIIHFDPDNDNYNNSLIVIDPGNKKYDTQRLEDIKIVKKLTAIGATQS